MALFIHDDFLLTNEHSRRLYHEFAAPLPIIDYHNHLSPLDLATDRTFESLTQVWLGGDHYKWRAMRTLGVDEAYITGSKSDEEKFYAWANCVPLTIGNPLYHWTHLELKRYFDIDRLLNGQSAEYIYRACGEKLLDQKFSARGLLRQMNVHALCTTDDPLDDLASHQVCATDFKDISVFPAFRPDRAILIQLPGFNSYVTQLGKLLDTDIQTFDALLEALASRMEVFSVAGCFLSDHGLSYVPDVEISQTTANRVFQKKRRGEDPTPEDMETYIATLMYYLGIQYAKRGWTMQLHLGAIRNNNARMMEKLGPDSGFDSIGDFPQVGGLRRLFDALDSAEALPKTIVYNLNPADNEAVCAMLGNYQGSNLHGKMQYGSAWWFLDQINGIEHQLEVVSNMGLLSTFIGMLTDSRSFLSFPRHEYFRRVLCDYLGRDMARGRLPGDYALIGKIIQDICFYNARSYFGLDKEQKTS